MQTASSSRFEHVVRKTLLDNRVAGRKPDSIRGLARQMSRGDEMRFQTYKRSLFKWMKPGEPNPSRESRAIVADALGIERGLLNEDDDEESDPVTDLMTALRRVFVARTELQMTEPTASLARATVGSEPEGV